MDRIWTIPPLFKTDEELSGRSLCLWWTRCAVRGYGGSPRPPIGRERRDREQYRHEGTNYPPTITTTIRTRPPPPSATTPRFDMKDEERWTETEQGLDKDDVMSRDCDGKREIAKIECVRERVRWKNECTIVRILYLSFSLFLPPCTLHPFFRFRGGSISFLKNCLKYFLLTQQVR